MHKSVQRKSLIQRINNNGLIEPENFQCEIVFEFTSFVATVTAIVFRVTFPGGRDTATVVTSELGSVAGDIDAARLV